jgi:hypothetical protein
MKKINVREIKNGLEDIFVGDILVFGDREETVWGVDESTGTLGTERITKRVGKVVNLKIVVYEGIKTSFDSKGIVYATGETIR